MNCPIDRSNDPDLTTLKKNLKKLIQLDLSRFIMAPKVGDMSHMTAGILLHL